MENNVTPHEQLAKADCYRLLSACYYEPEDAFQKEGLFTQLEAALSTCAPELSVDAAAMGACFQATGQDDLLLDYTRLFLGPVDIRAKPYGSIYLDGDNEVMGESTLEVQKFYQEGGFQVEEAFDEMPDHAAVELEFLFLLNARLGNGFNEPGDDTRLAALTGRFLTEHLGQWIVPFTNDMRNGAETEFYERLSELTCRFVLADLQKTITDN